MILYLGKEGFLCRMKSEECRMILVMSGPITFDFKITKWLIFEYLVRRGGAPYEMRGWGSIIITILSTLYGLNFNVN
jgi:hypothetical protein